jgi:hypothetical protein
VPQFIACYDLQAASDPWDEFLDQAEQLGWVRYIWGPKNAKWLRLPNTTVVGDFADSASARNAFNKAIAAAEAKIGCNIKVTKHLIGTFAETNFASDEKLDPLE